MNTMKSSYLNYESTSSTTSTTSFAASAAASTAASTVVISDGVAICSSAKTIASANRLQGN